MSSWATTAAFEKRWNALVNPVVAQLRAPRQLVMIVDARLTEIETALKQQPVRGHKPPQGPSADARPRLPSDPLAPVIPPETARMSPVTTTHVMRFSTLSRTATHFSYTDVLLNSLH